jgi:hypothetical protein
MEKNKCGNRYSPEVRERAVRMVFEHQGEFDSQSAGDCCINGFGTDWCFEGV